jgi:hypothetical protein
MVGTYVLKNKKDPNASSLFLACEFTGHNLEDVKLVAEHWLLMQLINEGQPDTMVISVETVVGFEAAAPKVGEYVVREHKIGVHPKVYPADVFKTTFKMITPEFQLMKKQEA